jgi:hypothetical protein
MLVEGTLVTLPVLVVLFLRLQKEAEARQSLLERGIDPRRARRAVRYGRWRRLADPL